MANTKIRKSDTAVDDELMEKLTEIGVLYSHKRSKAHPNMRPFIGANRHEIDILDARAVIDSINKSSHFLEKVLGKKDGGLVLFVGTSPAARDLVENLAKKLKQAYVVNRWLGGTPTRKY